MYIRYWPFGFMQEICTGRKPLSSMAVAAFVQERDVNRTEIGGLAADLDIDYELPLRSAEIL